MAGTDKKISAPPSLPLYLAGAVITLCGVLAAYSTLSMPDPNWLVGTLIVASLGFAFSFGSRRLSIPAALANIGFGTLALLAAAAFGTGQISLEQFLPEGADIAQMRLLCALVWGAALWAWALRNDNRVMGCMVPAMAALGLSVENNPNNDVLIYFGIFILTVVFLLIHLNFLQNRDRASLPERNQMPPRLLTAQFAQAGLCGLIVLLLGLAVIVPAQAVFARLSLAQAIRHLALGKPNAANGGLAVHFSDEDNLQIGTGEAWSASTEVVMHVTPSDGQEHLWRGRTYDEYTGDGWQSSVGNQFLPAEALEGNSSYVLPADLTPGDGPDPNAPSLTATFTVMGDTSQFYYAAAPRRLALPAAAMPRPRLCRDGRVDLADTGSIHFSYAVTSQTAPDPMLPAEQNLLRRAGMDYPPEVRALYLPLKRNALTTDADLTFYRQMLSEALQTLPPGQLNPLDESLTIRAWVSQRCVYSLAVPPIPSGTDHVHAFLGQTRLGYCDMFASSMVVLCRTAGIPARLATGFAPGEPAGEGYNLRGEDKHAWVEVYFPGAGWAAFDPTAGSRTDGSVPGSLILHRNELLTWLLHLHFISMEDMVPLLLLTGAIALILVYVVKFEVFDRRRTMKARGPHAGNCPLMHFTALGRQYARLCRALARLGLPRRPSETPVEYAARASVFLEAQAQEIGLKLPPLLVAELTEAFTRACYGDETTAAVDAAVWNHSLSQLETAARTVWWRRLWRRTRRIPAVPAR